MRFPKDGTPYIQKFCEAFEQGQSLSIMDFFMDIAERVKECRYAATRKTCVITPEIKILGVLALHKTSLDVVCKIHSGLELWFREKKRSWYMTITQS